MTKETRKYHNLEGLRGLAALIVVFWHFTIGFLPFLVGFAATTRHTPLDKAISTSPLFLLFAGSFSVVVFFVLSGFVLSISFFKHKTIDTLVSSASRRYLRLMIPAFGSVIFSYLLLKIIGAHTHQTAAQTTQSPWLASFWNFPPSFFDAFVQGMYGVFFHSNLSTYNTSLWTMYIELAGSFVVFGFLALFGSLQKRWIAYLVFSILFVKTYFLAFIFGMALCDVWHNVPRANEYIKPSYAAALFLVGIFLGSWHTTGNIYSSVYGLISVPRLSPPMVEQIARTFGALFIIIAVLRLKRLTAFFELKPLQYLGRISFALYLVHFAIIYSFSCVLFNRLYPHLGYVLSFIIMFAVSMPLIFTLAHFYAKYVDAPSIVWSKKVGNWLISNRSAKATTEQIAEESPKLDTVPQTAPAPAE